MTKGLAILLFVSLCSYNCTSKQPVQIPPYGDWIAAKDTIDPRERLTSSSISFKFDGSWHSHYRGIGFADSSKGQYSIHSDSIIMIREIRGYQSEISLWVFKKQIDTIKCKFELRSDTLIFPCMFKPYDVIYMKNTKN